MPSRPAFQHQHSSGSCTPLPESSTTLNHTTTSLRHSKPCIGFQSSTGSNSSCVSGPSSHQQQGTCLPTEPPDNHCVRVWSGIKPLGQQQRPCQAVNQTQPDTASGISCPPTSKPSQTLVFLGAKSKLFYFCGNTISTHSHCSGPPVNCRWQHRLCVVFYHLVNNINDRCNIQK